MLWTTSTREARISLKDDTQLHHKDLAELGDHARDYSKKELVHLIEERQEELVDGLCGPRYSRGHLYRRGGSYTKRLVTSLDEIRFKVRKVISRVDGKVYSPILEALDVKGRRYSRM